MLRCRRSTAAALVLLTFWPSLGFGQTTRAGIVSTLEGTVTATRVALPQPVPLKFRDEVFLQDRITTGEKSLARLLLGGAAVVTIRERSVLTITEMPGKSTIQLGAGKIGLSVARDRLRPGDQIEIRTPNAVAGVRGTVVVAEVLQATAQVPPPGAATVTTRFFVLRGEIGAAGLDQATNAPAGVAHIVRVGQSFQRIGFSPPVLGPNPPLPQIVQGLQPSQPQHVEAANAAHLKEQVMEQTAALVEAIAGGQATWPDPLFRPDPWSPDYLPGDCQQRPDGLSCPEGDFIESGTMVPSDGPPLRTVAAPAIRFVGPDTMFSEEEALALLANAEIIISLPAGSLALGGSDVLAAAELGTIQSIFATGALFGTASGLSTFILSTAPAGESAVLTDALFTPTVALEGVSLDATEPSPFAIFATNTDVVSTGGPLLSATDSFIESARRLLDLNHSALLAGGLELMAGDAVFTTDVVRVRSDGMLVNLAPTVSVSDGSTLTVSDGSILNVDGGFVQGPVLSAVNSTVDVAGDGILVHNGGQLVPGSPTIQLEGSTLEAGQSLLRILGASVVQAAPLLLSSGSTVTVGDAVVTLVDAGTLANVGALVQMIGGSLTASSIIALGASGSTVLLQGPLLEASAGAQVTLARLIRDDSDGTATVDYSAIGSEPIVRLSGSTLTVVDSSAPAALFTIAGNVTSPGGLLEVTSSVLTLDAGALAAVSGTLQSPAPLFSFLVNGATFTTSPTALLRLLGGSVTAPVLLSNATALNFGGGALVLMDGGVLTSTSTAPLFQVTGGSVTAASLIHFESGFNDLQLDNSLLAIIQGAVTLQRLYTEGSGEPSIAIEYSGLGATDLVRVTGGSLTLTDSAPMFRFVGGTERIEGGLLRVENGGTVTTAGDVFRTETGTLDLTAPVVTTAGPNNTLQRTVAGPLLVVGTSSELSVVGGAPVLDLSGPTSLINFDSLILVTDNGELVANGSLIVLALASNVSVGEGALIEILNGGSMFMDGGGPVVHLTGAGGLRSLTAGAIVRVDPDVTSAMLVGPLLDVTGTDVVLRELIADNDQLDAQIATAVALVRLQGDASLTLGPEAALETSPVLRLDGDVVSASALVSVDGVSTTVGPRVTLRNVDVNVSQDGGRLVEVLSVAEIRSGLLLVAGSTVFIDGEAVYVGAALTQAVSSAPLVEFRNTQLMRIGDVLRIEGAGLTATGPVLRMDTVEAVIDEKLVHLRDGAALIATAEIVVLDNLSTVDLLPDGCLSGTPCAAVLADSSRITLAGGGPAVRIANESELVADALFHFSGAIPANAFSLTGGLLDLAADAMVSLARFIGADDIVNVQWTPVGPAAHVRTGAQLFLDEFFGDNVRFPSGLDFGARAIVEVDSGGTVTINGNPAFRWTAESGTLRAAAIIKTGGGGNTLNLTDTIFAMDGGAAVLDRVVDIGPGDTVNHFTSLLASLLDPAIVSVLNGATLTADTLLTFDSTAFTFAVRPAGAVLAIDDADVTVTRRVIEAVGDGVIQMQDSAPVVALTGGTLGGTLAVNPMGTVADAALVEIRSTDAANAPLALDVAGLVEVTNTANPDSTLDPTCDGCAVQVRGNTVRVDQALLEATAPVIKLLGASLKSTGDVVRVVNGGTINAGGDLVSLNNSRMFVDGNLVTVTGNGSLLMADKLLVLNGDSRLDVRNGLLLDVASNATVAVTCLICFTNTNNAVTVQNTIAPTTVLFGQPIVNNGSIQGDVNPFQGLGVDNTITVSPGGSLLRVQAGGTLILPAD